MEETELAEAYSKAIEIFRRLTSGRLRLAAALLLGAAIEEAFDQGLTETAMTERIFQIARDRERAMVGE